MTLQSKTWEAKHHIIEPLNCLPLHGFLPKSTWYILTHKTPPASCILNIITVCKYIHKKNLEWWFKWQQRGIVWSNKDFLQLIFTASAMNWTFFCCKKTKHRNNKYDNPLRSSLDGKTNMQNGICSRLKARRSLLHGRPMNLTLDSSLSVIYDQTAPKPGIYCPLLLSVRLDHKKVHRSSHFARQ